MEPTSPLKKLKSPTALTPPLNSKTSITCTNVPEGLFEQNASKKHFVKFGRVQRIRLFPKKQMCIVEYDQPSAMERALLNAGAYDGFMFDVTRTKQRMRKLSKRDDDPDWLPDSDVKEELSALAKTPVYRLSRQKPMELEAELGKPKALTRPLKQSPARKQTPRERPVAVPQASSAVETPTVVLPTSLSNSEAALELHQLKSRISTTPDEQWRTLDARDRILRAWGGAGSRVKVGGATIGTCPDMCPEKELLHRQAEHQVMNLETYPDSDGLLEPWRAVKQYSRSSADQEIPMCYELRPASVLMRTCSYLLQEVADTKRQVSLADWFHFMWDRFRGIRKDITQQALCCSESIQLVEMCARFHAHCAARLADLEHTQFDQKLNTDNLTKCLQTLKHMYADVDSDKKPREAEFRGYIALLNLGDSNFWWEIKQLPIEIQKSEHIVFAIKIFNALDNNNYVRFFRLIKERATYLQACILLRYINDVRARALARIVKAYAPRGGSRFPAEDLINALAFESAESMVSFITHYGLRISKSDDLGLGIILDRNQFIEDSDPYPMSRALDLIESKRTESVGNVIAGSSLPVYNFSQQNLYSSFTNEGKLKESALVAEDLGYNTTNDSNKDVKALKTEIVKLSQSSKNLISVYNAPKPVQTQRESFPPRSEAKVSYGKSRNPFVAPTEETSKFSFTPAIPVAPVELIKKTPEKLFTCENKTVFSFSKPQESPEQDTEDIFKKKTSTDNIFKPEATNSGKVLPQNVFKIKNSDCKPSIFGPKLEETSKPVFGKIASDNIFAKKDEECKENQSVFGRAASSVFLKTEDKPKFPAPSSIFGQVKSTEKETKTSSNIFGIKAELAPGRSVFLKPEVEQNKSSSIFTPNGDTKQSCTSPGTLFKSALFTTQNGSLTKPGLVKHLSVADNIINSVPALTDNNIGENNIRDAEDAQSQEERYMQAKIAEEIRKEAENAAREEKRKREAEEAQRKQEIARLEEERRKKEEERKRQEELKRLEDKRRKEEEKRKQEDMLKKKEEERKLELQRKAEEDERNFKKRVEEESNELINDLCNEITDECVKDVVISEIRWLKQLILEAENTSNDILKELCDEISTAELKSERFWTEKVSKKWFAVWKKNVTRNLSQRNLLECTPVWVTERTAIQEASILRRKVEESTLKNMNKIHKGYRFSGEPNLIQSPHPFNLMEVIKTPLLKRMKLINYPYDKCFFWKITLVSPGANKWLYRKINIQQWLIDAFSDNKNHQTSETLINVGLHSWNNLMNFAISASLVTNKSESEYREALEGSNGAIFYATDNDNGMFENIQKTLENKYPYQNIPIAVIVSEGAELTYINQLESYLIENVQKSLISSYRIFMVKRGSLAESLYSVTKSALKWVAKNYPPLPPLEIDLLKSLCQQHLANEIWCKLRTERDTRMSYVVRDMPKLIKCYNSAVDKLKEVLTNEDLFNYPSFPLEFNTFLNKDSPYPKPYEFIPSNTRNADNASAIKNVMEQIKLPESMSKFDPQSVTNMQEQIREYCNQIGWFENSEEVACKVIALLPNELTDHNITCEDFREQFENYDLIDFLNVIVYEKLCKIKCFENLFAMYNKSEMEQYRTLNWLYNTDTICKLKHKALEYEDDLDFFMDAKRRKIASESMECLMLEESDKTVVEDNVKVITENIIQYSNCKDAVEQLEKQIEAEKMKSLELEMLLQSALSDM